MSVVMPPPRSGRRPREAGSCGHRPIRGGETARDWPAPCGPARLLLDDREHVTGGEHEVLLARVLHFGAAVLAVENDIASLDVHRDALGASVVEAAWADGDDLALLGLLLGGVRDDKAGCCGLLGVERAHYDPVFERLDNNLGGGRHDLTSPLRKGLAELLEATTGLPSRVPGQPRRIS